MPESIRQMVERDGRPRCLGCGEPECICVFCDYCEESGHDETSCEWGREEPDFEDEEYDWVRARDGYGFADPGGNSALRAATFDICPSCREDIDDEDDYCRHCGHRLNPRKHPCPTCGRENLLTRLDVDNHYQCDSCANALERGLDPLG